MFWQAVTLLVLALCAHGRQIGNSEQKRGNHQEHHGELNHIGSHKPEHHEEYAWAYPSYDFSYSVNDPHTHDQKSQHERRRGDEVEGEYWAVQPDGKKRTVKYRSDKHKGFIAHVQYTDHHHPHHREEPRVEEVAEKEEEPAPRPIEVREPNVEDEREEESELIYRPLLQNDRHHREPADSNSLVLSLTQFKDGTEELSPIRVSEVRANKKPQPSKTVTHHRYNRPYYQSRHHYRAPVKQQYNE